MNIPLGILIGLIAGAVILLIARQPSGQPIRLEPKPSLAPYVVHVDGAVIHPGVYSLAPGSRVQQAIDGAGGYAPDAQTTSINLAAVIEDGQKIYVPKQGEVLPQAPASSGGSGSLIDINTAAMDMLVSLPGIGEDRARAIIAYRDANGGFKTIEELQNIEGIGQATYDKLKDLVTVNHAP